MPDSPSLVDMHCHLDRMANARQVARDAAGRGVAIFDATVAPGDSAAAAEAFADLPNVRVGVGLHPWWIADGSCSLGDARAAARQALRARYIGEIGLDGSNRFSSSFELQRQALALILDALASAQAGDPASRRVISLHAVRAAGVVLDMLEERRLIPGTACACVFHWFSGTSDELTRLRRMGCYVSVNEHMLATKRGREYARVIPLRQLLLETDAPPGLDSAYSAEALERSLLSTARTIAALKEWTPEEVRAATTANALALLGMDGGHRGDGTRQAW